MLFTKKHEAISLFSQRRNHANGLRQCTMHNCIMSNMMQYCATRPESTIKILKVYENIKTK